MVFLTRFYLIFLFTIPGCTLTDALVPFYNSNFNDKLVEEKLLNSKTNSALYLINRKKYFAQLTNENNSIEKWELNGSHVLTIKNGKVIRSKGLKYDFEIIGYKSFNHLHSHSKALLKFSDPESGYLDILFSYKDVSSVGVTNNLTSNYRIIEENFSVPLIKWKGKNYYWVDDNNRIFRSTQSVSPFGDKISLIEIKHSE